MNTDTLRTAASTFLASVDITAWEQRHRDQTLALLRQVTAGALDGDTLRAALGDPSTPTRARPTTPKTTAILSLTGVLTPGESFFSWLGLGTSVRAFLGDLATAVGDDAVRSIVIVVDSPGGLVGMMPEAAAAVRTAREQKPVVVSVAGMNASAAYWITSNATRIEATPSALVGSIGVFSERVSVARQLEADGVDVTVFASSPGKVEGLPSTTVTDAERRATQARIDETFGVFVDDVAAGRRVPASIVRSGFGEGRIVSATNALRLGMIDRIATVEETIARLVAEPEVAATLQAKRDAITRALLAGPRARQTAAALASHRRELAAVRERVGNIQ